MRQGAPSRLDRARAAHPVAWGLGIGLASATLVAGLVPAGSQWLAGALTGAADRWTCGPMEAAVSLGRDRNRLRLGAWLWGTSFAALLYTIQLAVTLPRTPDTEAVIQAVVTAIVTGAILTGIAYRIGLVAPVVCGIDVDTGLACTERGRAVLGIWPGIAVLSWCGGAGLICTAGAAYLASSGI